MPNVISIREVRERREAEEHAEALVLYECATTLARQNNPALRRVIDEVFGKTFVDERVREAVEPRVRNEAPKHPSARRRPAR